MGRSLKVGSVAGIRIQVHWTFALIIAWVLLASVASGGSFLAAVSSVGFVLVLFGCVVLHELGHAMAARYFGIATRDITLLPIGGVARLERMPRKPTQELVVALAGPAVNVVIAAILLAILLPTVGLNGLAAVPMQSGGFLQQLLVVNVILVVFNMLPAFPLDGGRVLRALLAMVLGFGRATRVAAGIGQVCAVGLGFLGLMNPFLFFIAVFIFFGATAEARQVAFSDRFAGYQVRDGMIRTFRAVPADASIRDLAEQLLDGPQRDYPVVRGGELVGMLGRDQLLTSLERGEQVRVSEVMEQNFETVDESDQLVSVFEKAPSVGGQSLPVTDQGALTGLLDLRQALELIKARNSLRETASRQARVAFEQPTTNAT